MEIVFVYGTLKRGYSNNALLRSSKLLGRAITKERFTMFEDGIPYVSKYIQTSRISGEVYAVSKSTLDNLDMLEGHPSWYKREKTHIEYLNDQGDTKTINAWLYFNESIPERANINKQGIYGYKENNRFRTLLY
tara:strand:- start:591 stop:992 length:402 start_codon:yes stop_codon:yes gene_type:complete